MPLWLCGCVLFGASASAIAQQACEVVAVSGDAQREGRPLAVGDKLDVGTTLRTGANGRVRLKFADGSVLVLADKSQLRIDAFSASTSAKPREAEFLLELGLIGQKVSPIPGGSWKVRTPTAVTAVRGTEFSVEVGDDRATAVHVKTGEVDVEPTGPQTRGVKPRYPVRLSRQLNGTQCDAKECNAAMTWSVDRVQRLDQRLGSLD